MSNDAVRAIRLLGTPWETLDPFIFAVHHLDHYPAGNERLGPAASLAGRDSGRDFAGKDGWRMYHGDVVPGFPNHPHRGFETVTVVQRGLIDHSDSLGASGRFGAGDVQWLTGGRGIQHAEMFPLVDRERPNPLEFFQIWLNLPREQKMVEPHFSMLWRERVPRHRARDEAGRETEITLVAGSLGGLVPPSPPPASWASRPEAEVAIWTIKLAPGARWTLPTASPGLNRTLYFFRGDAVRVGDAPIATGHAVDLRSDTAARIENVAGEAELLLLQGRPIGEPVVAHGPFVMTSPEELQRAYADYHRTRFGGWPWPVNGPVHPRAESRFARHADGRVEHPA